MIIISEKKTFEEIKREKIKQREEEREKLLKEIKIFHDKANDLMEKKRILEQNIARWFKDLGNTRSNTKKYTNIKEKIERNQEKNRRLSAEITNTLRKKDLLLNKFNKKFFF